MHIGNQCRLGAILVAISYVIGDTFFENLQSRFAVNDRFAITAQNSISLLTFLFTTDNISCQMLFSSLGIEFIQDIAVGRKEVGEIYTFAFIAKLKTSSGRHLVLGIGERIPECLKFTNMFTLNLTNAADPGNQWILAMHPAGGLALVVSNRFGFFLNSNRVAGEWLRWEDGKGKFYPRAMDISNDGFIFVATHTHFMNGQIDNDDPDRKVILVDMPIPSLFCFKLDGGIISQKVLQLMGVIDLLSEGIDFRQQTVMTISVAGAVQNRDWSVMIGLPYMDTVFLVRVLIDGSLIAKMHRSPQKGVNFGHSIYMTENRTYAVLASSLPTLPWSSSRVQASIFRFMTEFSFELFISTRALQRNHD
ncbi:hypothetical protein I4U23_021823 [Adineta vaga]|nr:hypothetical protein I4U23_021823 [Adineta vaga]